MDLSPQELTVIGTISGAIVGALPGLISSFINRRAEERKQFNDIVIKAAMETWKTHVEHAGDRQIFPLEHYIVNTAKMCELVLVDRKISPETMRAHLKELDELMETLEKHASPQRPKKQA